MKTRNRTSITALLLGTILVVPGVGAMVCAPEAGCMTEASPAETMERCAGLQQREAEESVRSAASEVDCCLEAAEPAEPSPALAASVDSTRVDLDLATPMATPASVALVIHDRGRDGPDPDGAHSPAPSGRDLRTLHQSFLN